MDQPIESSGAQAAALTRRLLVLSALLAALLIAAAFDRSISDYCRENLQTRVARKIATVGGIVGGRYVWPAVAIVLLAFPNRVRILAAYLGTLLACTGVLHALKFTIGRARPEDIQFGDQTFHFAPFSGGDHDGFPSGHAMTAFLVALFIARLFPPLRWPILVVAVVSASTRVALLAHYPSDVVGGFALALLGVWTAQRIFGPAWFDPWVSAKPAALDPPPPPSHGEG